MFQFTLYCFSKTFELPYSGDSSNIKERKHLYNLFATENSASALTKVVSGETSGSNWVYMISINENKCKPIKEEVIKYVYRKIIQKPVNDTSKATLLRELLEHSLILDLDTQRKNYTNRNSPELQQYINSMRNMEETCFQSDEIFLLKNEDNKQQQIKDNLETQIQLEEEVKRLKKYLERGEEYKIASFETDFFNEYLINGNFQLYGIDLAFHTGTEWLLSEDRIKILVRLKENHIPCRVILNDKLGESLHKHMRNSNKTYLSTSDMINRWYNYKKEYFTELSIKISPLPLLHNYYHLINKNNPQDSIIRLCYYTYGNHQYIDNYVQTFTPVTPYYHVYTNEFNYLWENSKDIDEYLIENS